MKIPVGEIPEPEIDEFGDVIIKPIIAAEYVKDGVLIQELANHEQYAAYKKQVARNRDAKMLERGEINEEGLRRKNGFLNKFDFSKVRILAVGNRNYEDID